MYLPSGVTKSRIRLKQSLSYLVVCLCIMPNNMCGVQVTVRISRFILFAPVDPDPFVDVLIRELMYF
ncbi:hypothetical protein BDV34DRAFT_59896 [Aspergillus parasiticus]|uniref:Uncharacterized protein n=1 Tax=Aspergillus parasiticus TaxID=5067 RepID=A0A5N6DRN8_ASPPA|nr:hypothetical protein BDV34DRAFT_59896 [Aspergillus parasiticus]